MNGPKKPIVVYFSCTGRTEHVAQRVASMLDAPAVALKPVEPYTDADLDWENATSRVSVEHREPASRPQIRPLEVGLDAYDSIFLGFPIWWDLEPPVIRTFLESYDLRDKTIYPFATSAESTIMDADIDLNRRYDGLIWMPGLRFPADDEQVRAWINHRD